MTTYTDQIINIIGRDRGGFLTFQGGSVPVGGMSVRLRVDTLYSTRCPIRWKG